MMRRSNNQAYACQIGSLVYLGCASFKKKRLLPAWRCSEAAAAGKGWLGDGLASSTLHHREFVNEIARRQHPAPEPARQGGKQLEALPRGARAAEKGTPQQPQLLFLQKF